MAYVHFVVVGVCEFLSAFIGWKGVSFTSEIIARNIADILLLPVRLVISPGQDFWGIAYILNSCLWGVVIGYVINRITPHFR